MAHTLFFSYLFSPILAGTGWGYLRHKLCVCMCVCVLGVLIIHSHVNHMLAYSSRTCWSAGLQLRICQNWGVCQTTQSDINFLDFKRRNWDVVVEILCFYTLFHPPFSQLSRSFIHPLDRPPPPLSEKSSLHNKPGIFQMIPPDTFPVPSAEAALTLFLFAQLHQWNPEQAGRQAGIIVLWPAFPSSHHQVFKSDQVSQQRESEYEERGIIGKCQPCDVRCLNAVPEFVYFPHHRFACTSRLLLSPTSSRLSNPLWQGSWPW